jgi:hypothetical protein
MNHTKKLPRCAWLLIGSLFFLLSHTIGTAATLALPFQLAAWVIPTPAADAPSTPTPNPPPGRQPPWPARSAAPPAPSTTP